MSKWIMRAHFRHLHFNSFPMIKELFNARCFDLCNRSLKVRGVHRDSNSPKWKLTWECESSSSHSLTPLLAHALINLYLGREPKVKVATSNLPFKVFYFWSNLATIATILWKSVRMRLTLPKWGVGSPPRLPKLHSLIARVKTLHIEVFFISLESYQNINVENGLAWAIWTSATRIMAKRKARSQTSSLTLDH
jgi:hypothetical protein